MTILVTGAAGFIGAHVLGRLLRQGRRAVGLDNFNDYYDVGLKRARVAALVEAYGGQVDALDCADGPALRRCIEQHGVTSIIHLAAQAGVRYSLQNPGAYVHSNMVGFANVLECCRQTGIGNLVYASSSSVYGNHENLPWHEDDAIAHPVSLYAATKASNELLAHSYAHLYGIAATGLRFFTVYGPWGRPDMAPMLFSRAILEGQPIRVFNHGRMLRDFTFIDDVVEAVCRCADKPATPDPSFDTRQPRPATSSAAHRLFNVGNHTPVELMRFIDLLESALGRSALRQFEPMAPGDVLATYASTERLEAWVGFKPWTALETGISEFADWYRSYHAAARSRA